MSPRGAPPAGDPPAQAQAETPPPPPASKACQSVLARAKELWPHAGVASKVLTTLQDAQASADVLRQEISVDQGLTTIVLRAASSVYYMRASGGVRDLTESIVVLGYDTLRELVIARLARSVMRQHDEVEQTLWRHSLASALAAQACARIVRRVTVSHAFTCGMLHDVGQGTLYYVFGRQYADLMARGAADRRNFQEFERRELGTDHGEVGAQLLLTWKLPSSYSAAAMHHHRPEAAGSAVAEKDKRLLWMITLSSDVAQAALRSADAPLGLEGHPMLAPLGLQPTAPAMMADHVRQQLTSLEAIFT